jgi:hypothetical protein
MAGTPTEHTSAYTSTEVEEALGKALDIPDVTASDNNKVMAVVNGKWTAVQKVVVYSGSSTPSSSTGSNGDIYIQTS